MDLKCINKNSNKTYRLIILAGIKVNKYNKTVTITVLIRQNVGPLK